MADLERARERQGNSVTRIPRIPLSEDDDLTQENWSAVYAYSVLPKKGIQIASMPHMTSVLQTSGRK